MFVFADLIKDFHSSTFSIPRQTDFLYTIKDSIVSFEKEIERKRNIYAREKKSFGKQDGYKEKKRKQSVSRPFFVEINGSDSSQLRKINGIGKVFARRIIKFRNLLGGFHSPDQLREIFGMKEENFQKIVPYIRVDIELVKKLDLTSQSFKELLKHPYLEYQHVKYLFGLRDDKVENITDSLKVNFPLVFGRIEPYLVIP